MPTEHKAESQQHPCPRCGYCPCCGRGPAVVYPQPYWPWGWQPGRPIWGAGQTSPNQSRGTYVMSAS